MKRVSLRTKDVNKLLEKYKLELSKKDHVELLDEKIILVNGTPAFFYHDTHLVPTLKYLQDHPVLKRVVVDMGAVKFMVSGADVMRPGVVEIDPEISEGEYIVIVDVQHKKSLAIGKALHDGKTMLAMKSGRIIKNIHYVSDEIWNVKL